MEVKDEENRRPQSWLGSGEAKKLLLGVGLGRLGFIVQKAELLKKLIAIALSLTCSLFHRLRSQLSKESGRVGEEEWIGK